MRTMSDITRGAMTDEDRFWSHVNKTETCWLWVGLDGKDRNDNSYGWFRMGVDGGFKNVNAHTYAWFLATGVLDKPGMHLHHTCRNKRCVNPAHLMLLSPKEHAKYHEIKIRTGNRPGPVPGPDTATVILLIAPEIRDKGKREPGGLSRLVRELLREYFKKKEATDADAT